jgi:DNA-binding NarL/FixJ family response regulator
MRIALVDQFPVPRSAFAHLIRSVLPEVEIVEFAAAGEALEAAARAPFAMVVCGQSTGAVLGEQWMAQMVEAVRPAKLVVLAPKVDPARCARAQRAGAWGHVPVTHSAELFAAALRVLLAGGTYFPALAEAGPAAALSQRQLQVLRELEQGRSNKEIGQALGISTATVKLHVQSILKALGAKNRTQAARYARQEDLTA